MDKGPQIATQRSFDTLENRLPPIPTEDNWHLNLTCGFVVFTCSPVLRDRRERQEG